MKVAVLSTRLAGLDGVSLETQKMVDYFRKKGDEVVFCAGELDENFPGLLIPEMHFEDAVAKRLGARAFSPEEDPTLIADIEARATEIEAPLQTWVAKERPDLLVVQNCLAIPMQLPLAAALRRLIDSTGVRVLSHEHDFYFERERFATCCIPEFLEAHFPLDRPSIRHLTINTAAREQLLARRGIDSAVLPNVFRFEDPPPDTWPDAARVAAVRAALGVAASTRIILQPTRVVPRKGIELAVELVARVARSGTAGAGDVCLLISHPAGDEGDEYLSRVRALAAERGVRLLYAPEVFAADGAHGAGGFGLADAYAVAAAVTYPSLYEGFGNALLETVYFGLPALVNRYSVYVRDIAPRGFEFVEIDGAVTDAAVEAFARYLREPAHARAVAARNYAVALEHFSLSALARVLDAALQ